MIARLVLVLCMLAIARPAAAHCDSLDGPVVLAARDALNTGDFSLIAIWIKPAQEMALQHAFRHALAVRKLGPEARDLADQYFFETAVRLHRESEGEPFTGLKPAGEQSPVLLATERALATGDDRRLVEMIVAQVREGLHTRFRDAASTKVRRRSDVDAGRAYVARYIALIHYVVEVSRASGVVVERDETPKHHDH